MSKIEQLNRYFDANRLLWDAKTASHIESSFYNMPGFLKSKNSLNEIELSLFPNLQGLKVLHSQCHFGQDTLSLQNMGARCTGIDLSPAAIAKAKELNEALELNANFIVSNVYDLNKNLTDTFDLVFTSYGTITWLPNLNIWAKQLLDRLKPGGQFILVEFHPTLHLFNWDTRKVAYRYFNDGEPYEEIEEGTYADKEAKIGLKEYFWQHSFEDIISSLLNNGLQIEVFKEYNYSPYPIFDPIIEKTPGKYIFEVNGISIPAVYAIKGTKEA